MPLQAVDYFLLNEVEAEQLLQWKQDSEDDMDILAAALEAKFPHAAIVLTIGSAGAIFADGDKQFRQPAFRVKAVDTTAAGDTFSGFFIAGLLRGMTEEAAMEQAAKAAAIAVTRPGAAPSIPTKAEVDRF